MGEGFAASGPAASRHAHDPARHKPALLLVDDHPGNLLTLEAVLMDESCRLIRAESGTEALKRVLEEDFAVILLDVQMPGMDGFETAALIRGRERNRQTPIILLSAISKSDVFVFKGYSHGAVDYIFKPFSPEILRAKVHVFVELFKTRQLLVQESRRASVANELLRRTLGDMKRRVDAGAKARPAAKALREAAGRLLEGGAAAKADLEALGRLAAQVEAALD